MASEYFQGARTHFVTGKGGVGKTTFALVLAFAEASKGKRVLVFDFASAQGAASLFGVSANAERPHPVAEGIDVILATPEAALKEYVLQTIHFESVYNIFFENKWVKHFLRLMPSLAELVLLGKIWFHSKGEGERAYEVLIVDLPATGHAISMLQTPALIELMVPAGPMKSKAAGIKAWLENHDKTSLHVVTTPEELAVTEALKLIEACQNTLQMKLGKCVLNKMQTHLETKTLELLKDKNSSLNFLCDALEKYSAEIAQGEKELRRLPEGLQKNAWRLPWYGKERWSARDFQCLSQGVEVDA